jgi:hypothetical protein
MNVLFCLFVRRGKYGMLLKECFCNSNIKGFIQRHGEGHTWKTLLENIRVAFVLIDKLLVLILKENTISIITNNIYYTYGKFSDKMFPPKWAILR